MGKTVKEISFKAYESFDDAEFDLNSWKITVDVEGQVPPQSTEAMYQGVRRSYRLKPFRRVNAGGSYFELVYILVPRANDQLKNEN